MPGQSEKVQRRQVIIKTLRRSAVLDPDRLFAWDRVASISATIFSRSRDGWAQSALMPAAPEGGGTARLALRVEFALRGDVVDLAVGVIIRAAFGAIVASLAGNIITTTCSEISYPRSV
jgi:hypothetical protein